VELLVPYGKEGVLADIRKNVHVLSESYAWMNLPLLRAWEYR